MAGQLARVTTTPAALPRATLSAVLRRVADWDPGDDTRPAPVVDRATLAAIEAELEPAPRAAIARELAELLAMYDPPKGSIEAHTKGCVDALSDVPLDLLREGMQRVKRERVYPSAPMPGELRKACAEALTERFKAVAKARIAATRYRPPSGPRTPPTEDQIKRVSAIVGTLAGGKRWA